MEKYGFVYIWYDRKYNRYYIGSHWGTENDKYVCSSNSMRDAYRRRKFDFKRRIISRVYTNRQDLLNEEQRWLDMISRKDFGCRYYNKNSKVHFYSWWANQSVKAEVALKIKNSGAGEKISKALKGKYVGEKHHAFGKPRTEEWIQNFKDNHPRPNLGKVWDRDIVEKRAKSTKASWANQSPEKKRQISAERKSRRHTPETKEKQRLAAIARYKTKTK